MLLGSIEDDVADESGELVIIVLLVAGLGSSGGSLLSLLSGLLGESLLGVEDTGGLREEADSLESAGDKSSAGNAGRERGSRSLGGDGPRSREGGSESGTADGLPGFWKLYVSSWSGVPVYLCAVYEGK